MSRAGASSSGSPQMRREPETVVPGVGVRVPGGPGVVAGLDELGLRGRVLGGLAALDEQRCSDPDGEVVLAALDFRTAPPEGGEFDEAELWAGPDPWADWEEPALLSPEELDGRYGPVDVRP